jgi:hypothetical protein
MKRTIAAAVVASFAMLAAMPRANAESFFQVEAGLGVAHAQTLSDGVWYQQGSVGDKLHVTTPAYMAGFTGTAYQHAAYDVRWHLDYVYIGQQSASCDCVADSDYDAAHHEVLSYASAQPFNGFGHVQGIAATLDAGYTYHGYRLGVEAGPWLFWETWHEVTQAPEGTIVANHKPDAQVSWVAGVNVSRGPLAVSYRYYNMPQKWNPYPGLIRAAHVVMLTYRY